MRGCPGTLSRPHLAQLSGFHPRLCFPTGISRDQRRYLGNGMTESTADVYTREKRNVVVKVWHEVANNLSEISMEGRMVREDLSHPDW